MLATLLGSGPSSLLQGGVSFFLLDFSLLLSLLRSILLTWSLPQSQPNFSLALQ